MSSPVPFAVLNISDSFERRELVRNVLSQSGMRVVEAADVQQALERLSREIDVVVLDIDVPDDIGFELCRTIKAARSESFLPVLFVATDSGVPANGAGSLNGCADGFLSRPIDPRELLTTVSSLSRLRNAERSRDLQALAARLHTETVASMNGGELTVALSGFASSIVEHFRVQAVAVWIHHEGMLRLVAFAGETRKGDKPIVSQFPIPMKLREKPAASKPLAARDLPDLELADRDWMRDRQFSSWHAYALSGQGRLAGFVALFSRDENSEEVARLLAASSDSVALGIERHYAQQAMQHSEEALERDAVRIRQLELELAGLERLADAAAPVAARAYGAAPLKESHVVQFEEAATEFRHLLDLALEERSNKINHRIPDGLRRLSDRLAFLRAGPRDVIDIYSTTLKRATESTTGRKDHACVEEGRLLVLELMGNLVSNYRALSLASASGRGRKHRPEEPEEARHNG